MGRSPMTTSDAATKSFVDQINNTAEFMLWRDIVTAAKTNPGLADLLDRAKEFYILGKDNG